MLLETPIGVMGAQLFFHEVMTALQWLDAAMPLGGVALSLGAELKQVRPQRRAAP